jgi:hypothetical protein
MGDLLFLHSLLKHILEFMLSNFHVVICMYKFSFTGYNALNSIQDVLLTNYNLFNTSNVIHK